MSTQTTALREKRPTSAKAKKTIVNVIVHAALSILAVIWLFPIFWVIMTSFRGEKGSYTRYFFP